MSVWPGLARPFVPARDGVLGWVAGAGTCARQGAMVVADLLLITIGVWLAYTLRFDLWVADPNGTTPPLALALVLPFLWVGALALCSAYTLAFVRSGITELQRVALASFGLAGVVGVLCYLTGFNLSRSFYVVFFATGVPVLIAARLLRRLVINRLCELGVVSLPVVLVGSTSHIDDIARVLRREKWLGFNIVGVLTDEDRFETPLGLPVLGGVQDVTERVRSGHLHAVIFTDGAFKESQHFKRTMWELEDHKVHVIVAPGMTDVSAERLASRPVAGLPLLHVSRPHAMRASHWNKRLFDIAGSGLLLLLALPVIAVTALAIKVEDRGPVFFKQTRVGIRGREFGCHKIRSMSVDAEAKKTALQAQNEGAGVLFKMARDPRVTRTGRFIRRFSIDELPQLWNVFTGEMSLVGPRPALPSEVAHYDPDATRRLDVRPGLTGLWQVSGRSDLSWEDAIRLDTYYVDNWSMMQDLVILARTVRAVLSSRGAY